MAYAVDNLPMLSALVALPLTGAWVADVTAGVVPGQDTVPLSGQVELDLDGLTLTGTVVRSDVADDRSIARVVGGQGGMSDEVAERYYKGSPRVRRIVEDILRAAGETLSADSSDAVLDTALNTWQRSREPAGLALSRLLEAHGGSWRMTPAGEVLVVGAEAWPVVTAAHTEVPGSEPASGTREYAWPGGPPPALLPGVTFEGGEVHQVEHELTADGLRTRLRSVEPRAFLERARSLLARDTWYSRLWSGVVEQQNGDGTIDVVVGTHGLTQVPIRHGIPGLRVLVSQGQRVLVGFVGDDPRQPFAALWGESGSAEFGTLSFSVALTGPLAGALIASPPPALFEPTTEGDDLADAAATAGQAQVTLTTGTVRVS